jgi:hypothetical protein
VSRYIVYINYTASQAVEVEADTPEAASDEAYNQASGSLCHQCAHHFTLGDPFGETIVDAVTGDEIPTPTR